MYICKICNLCVLCMYYCVHVCITYGTVICAAVVCTQGRVRREILWVKRMPIRHYVG